MTGSAFSRCRNVGWNSLHVVRRSWLLDGIDEGDQVYFTHSYAAPVTADCVARRATASTSPAPSSANHVAGVQFHPEKSGDVGLRILRNFLSG